MAPKPMTVLAVSVKALFLVKEQVSDGEAYKRASEALHVDAETNNAI